MKKTMVIAIIIVYILSIVAVNFFGLKIRNFDGKVYVKSIEYELELMRDEAEYGEEMSKFKDVYDTQETTKVYKTFNYVPGDYNKDNLTTNPNIVFIQPHVYPNDADNKRVKYVYDTASEEKGRFYFDQDTSTVYFFKANRALTITIEAADGSGVKTVLTILPLS